MTRAAIRIYWWASLLAVAEASLLFSLGLDLRTAQVQALLLFGFPAPLIMYLCDRWLIVRHSRPIDAVLDRLDGGPKVTDAEALKAYVQALNLPVLTLLRVLLIHAPAILIPATLAALVANRVMGLGLSWWEFLLIWSLWPITAVPHAVLEYFLIDRVVRGTLQRLEPVLGDKLMRPFSKAAPDQILRLLVGLPSDTAHVIRTSTGTQLAWVFVFVSLMPMCLLGASVYIKLPVGGAATGAQDLAPLRRWILCLIGLNAAVSVAIVRLASRRVHEAIAAQLSTMRHILTGDLSSRWNPRSTDEFLDLGAGCNEMLLGLREREALKETFGRFVSRQVAEAVLACRVPLGGELREVTVLFQDIRGFTSLSEKTAPKALLEVLNAFFTEMVAAVEAHGGMIKQFTGDGVMAIFGAPGPQQDHPIMAVRAGLAMLERVEEFNRQRTAVSAAAPLRIGVGIHTGDVVAGCIGPDCRVEYGVVGDAVNLASRVQGLTKEVGVALLVTQATAARLAKDFSFGKRALLPVRGKELPVEVVEVLGIASVNDQPILFD